MGISISEQLTVLLYSLTIGALICVLYDLFRILRIMFGAGKLMLLVQDLLFCLISTCIVIIFLFHANSGEIRWFAMAGAVFGFFVYYNTLSRVIIVAFMKIIRLVKKLLMIIYSHTILPILKMLLFLGRALKNIILKIKLNIKFVINHFKYKVIRYKINKKARHGFNLHK